MKRIWYITLRDNGILREWITTDVNEAMWFLHAFGLVGFRAYSEPYNGPEIPTVRTNYAS